MGRKRKVFRMATGENDIVFNPSETSDAKPESKQEHTPRKTSDEVAEKPKPEFMTPQSVDGLYDLIGKAMIFSAEKWKGVPPEIAAKAFTFQQNEKDMLREPTARVLNKHVPAWMVKYQDEIAVTLMVVAVVNAKIQLCNALLTANGPQSVPPPPSVPQPINGKEVKPAEPLQ
jgi:hypothetical protein